MELDLHRLFGLHMYSCTHWLRPRNFPPSHAFGLIYDYEGAIGQPRQATSLCNPLSKYIDENQFIKCMYVFLGTKVERIPKFLMRTFFYLPLYLHLCPYVSKCNQPIQRVGNQL
jgi:hypothetical protein